MVKANDLPVLFFESQPAWENWLSAHYQDPDGIWLKMAKKESGIPSINYAQALEAVLCYGWIDGQKASFDETYWLQKFSPRRPKSQWSKINREKAEALIAAGKMQPSGLIQVEQAKQDGRWEAAYASQSQATIPEDFQQALDENPAAKEFFNTLNSANRYAVLYRIHTAKKPETRAARIKKLVEMLEKKEKIHPG